MGGNHLEERDDRGRSKGQALVEFALVLPIMVVLFAAIVQFATIFERQIGIENASREVARRAAALPTNDGTAATNTVWAFNQLTCVGNGIPGDPCEKDGLLQSNVQGYSLSAVQQAQICYANAPAVDPSGNTYILVDVTIKYRHPLFVPIIAGLLDGFDGTTDSAFRVDTKVEFRVEGDAGGPLTFSPTCDPP